MRLSMKLTIKLTIKLIICSLILLTSITSLVNAGPKLEGSASELETYLNGVPKTVEITGTATSINSAHSAVIQLLVQTEAVKLADALIDNRKIRKELRQKLLSSSITEKNIIESKFSSTREYGWFGDEPKAYKVDNYLSVTINTEKEMIETAKMSDSHK